MVRIDRMITLQALVADIRSLRLAARQPQRDLARRARVEPSELRRWERGLELPPPDALRRIAAVFEVDVGLLRRAQNRFMKRAIPGEGYTTARPSQAGVLPRSGAVPTGALRVLDLFCGSGGFSYGFELTGRFVTTAGVDLLPDRTDTFRANHSSAAALIGDIRDLSMEEMDKAAGGPDVVIGGPPCQGFSSIRPFRALTEGDPRNNLFEQFALVVATLRPRWFVLENVVGLLTHADGHVFPALVTSLRDAGYRVDYRVINAAAFGLPQNRERLVVVGSRDGRTFEWPAPTHAVSHRSMAGRRAPQLRAEPLFHPEARPAVTVMNAIHDLPPIAAGEESTEYDASVRLTEFESMMRVGSPGLSLHHATAHSARMLSIIRVAGANRAALPEGLTTSGFSSCYSRLEPDRPSVTLTVNFVHPASNKCIHPYQDRALTPREGARLQGFPDRFRFCGNRAQVVKQIGNAVPPLLGRTIAEALAAQW